MPPYNKIALAILLFAGFFFLQSGVLQAQDLEEFDEDPFFSKPLSSFKSLPERYKKKVRKDLINSTFVGIDNSSGYDYAARNALNRLGQMGALPSSRFNRVDGLVLGLGVSTQQFDTDSNVLDNSLFDDDFFYDLNVTGNLSYSFKNKAFQYQLALEQSFFNYILGGVEWHDFTTSTETWKTGAIESSVTSFLSGYDYLNYFKAKGFSAYLTTKPYMLQLSVGYHWNRYNSLEAITRYSMFGGKSVVNENNPITEGKSQSVSAVVVFNPMNKLLSEGFSLNASFLAEIADDDQFELSDLSYNRYMANMKMSFRVDKNSTLSWRGLAYAVTAEDGNIPTQFLAVAGGPGTVMAHAAGSLFGTHLLVSNLELNFGRRQNMNMRWTNAHSSQNFDFDVDIDSPILGVFWDYGWVATQTNFTQTNPLEGFNSGVSVESLQTLGGVVTMGSLQFRLGWDPEDFNRTPSFLIRLNPRF